jgi:hypothetical protein
MSHKIVIYLWILALGLSTVALAHAAPPAVPTRTSAATGVTTAERKCGPNEEPVRTLKLTAIEDGVRVDYEFVRPGPKTWTHMNRPLLKQFGIRTGGIFCLPRDALVEQVADGV